MLWRRKTPSFITHIKKMKAKCASFKILNYVFLLCFYCVCNSLKCETSWWRNRLKFACAIVWSTVKTSERVLLCFYLETVEWLCAKGAGNETSLLAYLSFLQAEEFICTKGFFLLTKSLTMPVLVVFFKKQKYKMLYFCSKKQSFMMV